MNVLTRQEFIQYFNSLCEGLGDPNSPLWAQEEYFNIRSQWFVCVSPIKHNIEHQEWIKKYCSKVMCYSSGDEEEWWGFTHHNEIMLWLLRWG